MTRLINADTLMRSIPPEETASRFAVANAPTVKVPTWIPCSERLPENDDFVIITILDEQGDTPSRYTDFGWYLGTADCWIVGSEQKTYVTAWMPLPKPYEEEE